jgi:hypothetical protein
VRTFLACERRVQAAIEAGEVRLKYVRREWRTQNEACAVRAPGICSRIPHRGARVPPRITGMVLLALALAGSLRAQTTDSAAASPFRPLDLPTANDVRTGSGRPGRGYWQQRADYRIEATLDPATHELRGRETIHYVNRSPDPLPYLWLFVEQIICAPGSVTNHRDQPPLVFLGWTIDFSC